MGSDDRYDKEPKIPKLTKENHEKWFRNNKLKLKGKGIFYTIEVTKHAYAWIARHGAGTSTSTANTSQDPAGTVNPTEQASVLGLTSDFERLGGTWNAEKAKEYDKDEAKALFYITNSLLDDDDALADEYETASALWTALKVKYSKTDQLTANNIMTKLQNFTWKDEKDVDYTWAKLKEYRRKIIAAKPAAKGLYNDEALLQIMLRALPESYGSVIDYLDVQTSLTVDEKIAALRTKELRLNDTAEHANVAFPKYRHPNDHRSSDSSMRDRPRSTSPELGPSTGCLHCKGEHWARDCKYKGEIQEFGRKLREKDERAERRAAKSKRPSRNENKKRSDKPVKPTAKTTSRRKHGYAAKNQDSDSGTDNGSSGTDSETSHESTSVETELEDESEEMEVDEVTNPVAAEPSARYHFRTRTQKRKRDTFDDMEDEHRQAKIVKAMLAVLRESRADEDPTTEIPTSTHHHEESAHETIVKAFYTVIVSGNLDVTGRAELSGKAFAATESHQLKTHKMAVEKEEWKIPQLTAENHDTWFRRNKVKLKGKKVFYVCEKNLVQHCQIAIAGELTEAMEELEIAEADKHTKIRVNIEKRDKYLEDEATAIDLLFRSLTEDDQALIDEYDTAFQFWAYLQKKYTQTDATTANIYMTRIQTFTFNPGNTIVGSWEKLKEYRRKLVAADADTNGAYKDSALLLVLIRSLPKEFKTTIDTLNAQLNLTVEQKLKFLEEKEVRDQQDADEKALPAFRKTEKYVPPYKRRNHKSSPLSSDSESGTKFMVQCFLCDGAHGVRDCPRRERARKLLKEYDAKKSSKPPIKTLKQRNSHKKTGKAYGAEEVNSESDELSETSDSEPEEIETCRLSKDIVGKASPSTWAADTGASSHMSDQPSLFRRMIKIKRRLVRVGGGELYADWKGEAQVVCKDGSSTWLSEVLLVPNLGVNLLSAQMSMSKLSKLSQLACSAN
ncbi:Retrotran-gag-2 domain containing protein [Pyrenophora tritici-repentis]|uniref:Retrotran-gag-2 domain containing protein n=1 Tax=Pyrenophora tritici-repentis TaxID=45151 RepID=A0A922N7B8_9PLEO|nr:Retrotran-gag-2 domain containing protein [Pyrenophora tritici-repentis]